MALALLAGLAVLFLLHWLIFSSGGSDTTAAYTPEPPELTIEPKGRRRKPGEADRGMLEINLSTPSGNYSTNMSKVLEGKYDGNTKPKTGTAQSQTGGKPSTVDVLAGIIADEEGGGVFD